VGYLAIIVKSTRNEINRGIQRGILAVATEVPKTRDILAVRKICQITLEPVDNEKSIDTFDEVLAEQEKKSKIPLGIQDPRTQCLRIGYRVQALETQNWCID
jgi:hypothetical protein